MAIKTLMKKKATDKCDKDLLKVSDMKVKKVEKLIENKAKSEQLCKLYREKDMIEKEIEKLTEKLNAAKKELGKLIKDLEIMREELLKFTIKRTPYVSNEEMQEIEKTLSDDDLSDSDFVDGMKWLGR